MASCSLGSKKVYVIIVSLALVVLLCVQLFVIKKENTLLFVNAYFSHGEKSLINSYTYKNDPYNHHDYQPQEVGHLSMKSKRLIYDVGVQLRERYDSLLGEVYSKHLTTARTSKLPEAEENLLVLFSSLFKPTEEYEVEKGLAWQPAMYDVIQSDDDDMLAFYGKCKEYFGLLETVFLRTERFNKTHEKYREVLDYVAEATGEKCDTLRDVKDFYNILKYQKNHGLVLPEWTRKVYPETLKFFHREFFEALFENEDLVKYSAGRLLENFEESFRKKVAGKLRDEHKMNVYSGDEYGIYGILTGLNIDYTKVPLSAYILVELHNISGVYGVKIFYQDYTTEEPLLKRIGGCETFCPLHDFVKLTRKYYPNPNVCKDSFNDSINEVV